MKIMTAEEWNNAESQRDYDEYMQRSPIEDMQTYGDYVEQQVILQVYNAYKQRIKELEREVAKLQRCVEKPKTYTWEEVPVGHVFATKLCATRLKLSEDSYLGADDTVWNNAWRTSCIISHKPFKWGEE